MREDALTAVRLVIFFCLTFVFLLILIQLSACTPTPKRDALNRHSVSDHVLTKGINEAIRNYSITAKKKPMLPVERH